MVSKKKNQKKGESNNEAKSSSSSVMVTKKIKKQRSFGGGNFVADPMIKDPRFSPAHTDPRFRRLRRRDAKVTIDSRFRGVLTDKASAPVDKRGKKRRGDSAKDSLREYYRIEEDDKKKTDESESEEEEMKNLKAEAKRRKSEEDKKKKDESELESEEEMKSEEEPSEEESKSEELKLASSSSSDEKSESEEVSDEVSEEEEEDTDEDDEAMNVEEDGFEIPEEEITNIDKETHRLAVVNMDWRHISAKDLYVVFNSFVPKDGRIVSVSVYPTELGLERMKEEEIHGPKIDDEDNDSNSDSSSEEEEDEDIINQKIRAYEITRLKYYFAVVDCDSVTTADFLYKSCDGIEFERTSNKLDIRFIPDTMEFKHPPRDVATEAPSNYQGLDFQTQALQMSKVGVSWDEDEPHRAKTLNQKFNPDQLAELEKQEYIADYSGDESESNDDNEDGGNKYRALIDVKDSDNEEEENENDEKMDMEVTFHDGLEDLSKTVREKKEQKKSETVWDKSVREIKEKKKARKKNKKKNDSSSDDDRKAENGDDDFFMEEAKPKKEKKVKKKEEVAVEEERNRAELELLLADDENGNGGEGVKGYNIKKKKKKIVEEEEKIVPMAELDQPRFATKLLSDPNYALDPTDPQFKRSAAYVRQLAQKQKEVPRSQEEVKEATTTTMEVKPESKKKTERHETTNAIKSVKMKMKNQQKDSEERKKKTGNAESSSTTTTMTLAKIKKKLKDLSKK